MVSKKDLTELKSQAAPPQAVKDVLYATGILLGYDMSGDSWKTMKKALGNVNVFYETLMEKKDYSPEVKAKAKEALHGLTPDVVKRSSFPAGKLTKWCVDMIEQ